MSWEAVRSWRDALRADRHHVPSGPLSATGLQLVLGDALDALTDEALDTVARMDGEPFPEATFVAARTVSTASVEWLAVLLGRGTRVRLKHPRGAPGLAPWLVHHAERAALPLEATDRRDAVEAASLVVAMGDDDTMEALASQLPASTRFLGFGHRASLAWWGADAHDARAAEGLARDLAAHDSRGCMSPAVLLTDVPDRVLSILPDALDAAQRRWPRGQLTDAEHATLRTRTLLTRATGQVVQGEGWTVHVLPADRAIPAALPRTLQVVAVEDAGEAAAWARPWRDRLSTVGHAGAAPAIPAPRVCELGWMQRPPLLRHHDGIDHLRQTLR